jgi:hypothetical protein
VEACTKFSLILNEISVAVLLSLFHVLIETSIRLRGMRLLTPILIVLEENPKVTSCPKINGGVLGGSVPKYIHKKASR